MPFRSLVLLGAILAVSGCSKSSPPLPPDSVKAAPTRQELIASLVARGDMLSGKTEKWRALYPYEFAHVYAKEDAEITKKFESVKDGRSEAGYSQEEAEHSLWVLKNLPLDLEEWPAPAPGVELVELRILTDDRLVGNLQYGYVSIDAKDEKTKTLVYIGKPIMFVAKPKIKLAEVSTTYGDPSATKKHSDGPIALTYGRIRVLADKEGNVAAVLFRPDQSIRIDAVEE